MTNEEIESDGHILSYNNTKFNTFSIPTDTLLSTRYLPPEIKEYRIDWAGKTYYIKSGQVVDFYVDHIKVDGKRV